MKVIVLGAGVIGTTTAYYFAKAGHQVEVFDRHAEVAQEASFANAGQLSFGYSSPWAAPKIPLQALKWLFQRHSPMALKLTTDPDQYFWMLQLLFNCRQKPYLINKERMLRLAEYSRHCLDELRADTGIQYAGQQLGTTQVLRTNKQLKSVASDLQVLEKLGVAHEVLDAPGLLNVEPALANASVQLAGGIHFPHDQTGDCQLFTQSLATLAKGLGVKFHFQQNIWRLETKQDEAQRDEIDGVWIEGELHQADHYIVALGSFSNSFLKSLGMSIPVYPFKGYSITAKIAQSERAPRSTILDEAYKVAITRLGQNIRVGGMAEVVGYDLSLNTRRKATLAMVANQLYPQAAEYKEASFWCGLRPSTPDSTPLVGATAYENLWLNTGHGTLGWTMACGSGRILADLITTNIAEIQTDDLSVLRYEY